MHLLWTHGTGTGYGRYGTRLAETLRRHGVDYVETLEPGDIPHHLAVWVATPNHVRGWYAGQHKVLSTMWETDSLPEAFREHLHDFDQLIVPSAHNQGLFSRYHPNVAKVPLGVGAEWGYRKRVPPANRFVFLIAGNSPRKGVDLAITAFRKTFAGRHLSPRPVLIVKSPQPYPEALGEGVQNVTGKITDLEEIELFASAHCYLQPSRGEGFGLMPLQAIAQGCPTVLTDAHGHTEFSHLGWPVPARLTDSSDYIQLYGDGGCWWEPDLDHLCHRLQEIYNGYDEAVELAASDSRVAHRDFSWDVCACRFTEAIGAEHFERAYHGDRSWVNPQRARYPVRVNRFWACEIAGTVYQFTPGRDYWETADVKRILYDGGLLDPACCTDNPGLTPAQVARLDDYTAAQSYCHHCGQKLGTGERWQPEEVLL